VANAGINLKSLLLGDTPDATISTCTAMASSVARHSSDALPEIDWPSLAGDIGEKIGEMFDIPLVDLLIGAWNDLRALRDCGDPSRGGAGAHDTVPLVDHDLEASFKPHLDVIVAGMPTARVEFEISAGLELHAVVLVVENGTIRAVRVGFCQATAKVSCHGVTVFERSSRKLDWPGEIALPRPVPLNPAGETRGPLAVR